MHIRIKGDELKTVEVKTKTEENIKAEDKFLLPDWFALDNAATIYPATKKLNWNCIFRIAVILKDEIKPEVLKEALSHMVKRFPSFFVKLRKGLFWHYFERVENYDVIEEENDFPCRPIKLYNTEKPAFRVLYFKKRIALEVFHGVSDGGGALKFLKSLVAEYLSLQGHEIEKTDGVLSLEDVPMKEELEDSFEKNFKKKSGISRKEDSSYHYIPNKTLPNYLNIIHGIIPVEDIKTVSKFYGFSVTEYLTAVLIYSFYKQLKKPSKKPIKISVPITLRPIFDSNSLRNFSLYTIFGIKANRMDYTFDEVAEEIRGKLKSGIEKDTLSKILSQNVKDAKNPIIKFLPSALKESVLNIAFYLFGQTKMATSLTNVGIVSVPESMKEHIERFEVILGYMPMHHLLVGVCSFDNLLNVSLSADTREKGVARTFFTTIASHGVRVRVECNEEMEALK